MEKCQGRDWDGEELFNINPFQSSPLGNEMCGVKASPWEKCCVRTWSRALGQGRKTLLNTHLGLHGAGTAGLGYKPQFPKGNLERGEALHNGEALLAPRAPGILQGLGMLQGGSRDALRGLKMLQGLQESSRGWGCSEGSGDPPRAGDAPRAPGILQGDLGCSEGSRDVPGAGDDPRALGILQGSRDAPRIVQGLGMLRGCSGGFRMLRGLRGCSQHSRLSAGRGSGSGAGPGRALSHRTAGRHWQPAPRAGWPCARTRLRSRATGCRGRPERAGR